MRSEKRQFGLRKLLLLTTAVSVLLAIAPLLPSEFLVLASLVSFLSAICGFVLLLFATMSFSAWVIKKPGSGREFRKKECLNLTTYGIVAFMPLIVYAVVNQVAAGL